MSTLRAMMLATPSIVGTSCGSYAVAQEALTPLSRNETLNWEIAQGRVAEPHNFNPLLTTVDLENGFWQVGAESLFYLNYETGKLIPWLAQGYTYNGDFTEVEIKLRPGVKWSDGVPFSADDVVFTIQTIIKSPTLRYHSDMVSEVRGVTATDPETVKFQLKEADPRFITDNFGVKIWTTLLIVPKHVFEGKDPNTFNNYDPAKGWPVVTGAYKLVRSTPTEADWDRRKDWWGAATGFHPLPAPKRIIFSAVGTEESRAIMGANNQMDALYDVGRRTFELMKARNPKIEAWTANPPYGYPDPCPRDLQLNNDLPPFNNPDVRWAIDHAINRNALIAIAYEGATVPQAFDMPGYPALKPFFSRNKALASRVLDFDLKKTDQLMQKAGFKKDSSGFWVGSAGKRVELPIITAAGETDKIKMLPVIVQQLRTAGFDASSQILEWPVFTDAMARGTVAGFVHNLCGSVVDPAGALEAFESKYSAPIGQVATSGKQGSRFSDKNFDALVEQLVKLPASDPKFDGLADKAIRIWVDKLPVVPLVQAFFIVPYNSTYWTNWPTADNPYFFPLASWWVSGNMLVMNVKPAH